MVTATEDEPGDSEYISEHEERRNLRRLITSREWLRSLGT